MRIAVMGDAWGRQDHAGRGFLCGASGLRARAGAVSGCWRQAGVVFADGPNVADLEEQLQQSCAPDPGDQRGGCGVRSLPARSHRLSRGGERR